MKSILLAAAFAAIAAPAFADGQWTASPAQATTKHGIAAGDTVWNCDAGGCRTVSDTTGADSMSACRALARQTGVLTAYSADGKAYSAARLEICNGGAAKAKT